MYFPTIQNSAVYLSDSRASTFYTLCQLLIIIASKRKELLIGKTFKQRYNVTAADTMYTCLSFDVERLFCEAIKLLKPVSETHSCTLRSSVNGTLAVPMSYSSLFDRSYSYSAQKLWNSIPIPVRNSSRLNSFKNNIKPLL